MVGNDRDEHIFALAQSLDLYDFYQAKMLECDCKLEAAIAALEIKAATPPGLPPKARVKTRQVNAPSFDVRAALLRRDRRRFNPNPWPRTILGPGACRRMRHRVLRAWPSAKHFHFLALPCPWQQDIGRQTFVFANAAIFKPRCGTFAIGSRHDWPE
ncbi:MAG: hypothetical protein V9G14_09255 [Cypionkella sp.]